MKDKKLTKAEYWHNQTFGAWWMPYNPTNTITGKIASTNKLFVCDVCNNSYSFDTWAKRVYYYSQVPKLQPIKTCQKCNGGKVETINV